MKGQFVKAVGEDGAAGQAATMMAEDEEDEDEEEEEDNEEMAVREEEAQAARYGGQNFDVGLELTTILPENFLIASMGPMFDCFLYRGAFRSALHESN